MAVTLNARGTTVPYFKIGRRGSTIFQGATDPHPTYTVSPGDIWLDTTANTIKFRNGSNTWQASAGGVGGITDLTDVDTTSATPTNGQILVWDGSNWVPSDEYSNADVTTHLAAFDGSIIPDTDITYDLGSSTKQWRDLYIGPGSIYMNTNKIIEEDGTSGNLKFTGASNQNVHILSHGTGNSIIETSAGLQLVAHNAADIDLTVSTGDINLNGNVTAANNVTITGDLTVNGTTTTINTATLTVSDNIIVLNNDETGTPSQDAGIEIERGTETNVAIAWNETTDRWTFTNDGSTYANLPFSTDELTEGSTNLYYTDARVGAYLTANPQPGNTYGTQIVWDLSDPTNSIILDAGDGSTTQATYYGDVVDSNGNAVLDISGPAFYGSTNGNHNGDVYDATGNTLILDVDNGQGIAVLNGDVNGTNITTSNIDVSNYIKGYNSLIAPGAGATVNYVVTVAAKTTAHRYNGTGSSSGYVFNGLESPFLTLTPGRTYRFIQEDATNSGHVLAFYFEADKTTAYTDNVTFNGTPGQSGAYTEITITDSTPAVLHYQCTAHGYMGNSLQTNTRNLTGWTTDNLIEGTSLYYTDARVDTRISNTSIDALNDVDTTTTSPNTNDVLQWNGSSFVPSAISLTTATADDVYTHGDASYNSKEYVLFGNTTDATETELFIGGVANTRVPVAANTTIFYDIKFVARRTDASGEGGGIQIKGAVDNFSGTVADIGDLYEIIVATDNANIAVDATADDANNALKITVTGELAKNFRWTAFVKTVEVSQ